MNFNKIKTKIGDFVRYLGSIPGRIRALPPTIVLPGLIGWLQQKLWRIYFVEWTLATLIAGVFTGAVAESELISTALAGGIIMPFLGNRLAKFTLDLAHGIGKNLKLPGTGFVVSTLNVVFAFCYAFNYRLIRRFSAEKIRPDPWEKFKKRGKWKP